MACGSGSRCFYLSCSLHGRSFNLSFAFDRLEDGTIRARRLRTICLRIAREGSEHNAADPTPSGFDTPLAVDLHHSLISPGHPHVDGHNGEPHSKRGEERSGECKSFKTFLLSGVALWWSSKLGDPTASSICLSLLTTYLLRIPLKTP